MVRGELVEPNYKVELKKSDENLIMKITKETSKKKITQKINRRLTSTQNLI